MNPKRCESARKFVAGMKARDSTFLEMWDRMFAFEHKKFLPAYEKAMRDIESILNHGLEWCLYVDTATDPRLVGVFTIGRATLCKCLSSKVKVTEDFRSTFDLVAEKDDLFREVNALEDGLITAQSEFQKAAALRDVARAKLVSLRSWLEEREGQEEWKRGKSALIELRERKLRESQSAKLSEELEALARRYSR